MKKESLIDIIIKNHKDKNGGHPHVIVDNIDDKHVSVGLSTKLKKGKNNPNYKLEVNPLGDSKHSYARRQGTVAPQKDYSDPRSGKMSSKDYDRIKSYGKKAKQKYIEKRDKKK